MFILRKADFYIEAAILALVFISIPLLYVYGFLTGLFVLGIVQLLSAGLNTKAFLRKALKAQIKRYWIFTASILLILFVAFLFPGKKDQLLWIVAVPAIITSVYYLIIYQKLISNIRLRNELAGFTKS